MIPLTNVNPHPMGGIQIYLLESNENYSWAEFTSDDSIGVSDDTEAMRGEWEIDYNHLGSDIEIWDNYPLD